MRPRERGLVAGLAAAAWLLAAPALYAEEATAPGPMAKLARSAEHVLSSPADLIVCPVSLGKQGHPFVGLAKGVGQSMVRLVTGSVDVATFWMPGVSWADQLADPPFTCTPEMR